MANRTDDGFKGLRLYNTLTRKKAEFRPLDPAHVRMYVCGPTVYDYAHIGNARPIIVFDVLYRLLRHLYGEDHVTYVRNITDVDDKINQRAAEEGVPIDEVTARTIAQFHKDIKALGVLEPDVEPRATRHVAGMRAMIEDLVAKGFAYVADDHVLFSPAAMNAADGVLPRYGALANRSLDEMLAGARVDVAPYKKDPMDFVLWKPSKGGEPHWPSPCGIAAEGRPGWHIECSAMADEWLWERVKADLSEEACAHPHQFDIHGGGIDLVFPHHENELAQSCCAFGTDAMAQVWMHNGFLQVEGEKMSKSLGNFVTIHELLQTEKFGGNSWPGSVLRFAMLMTHYRQPIDWTHKGLETAFHTLDDLFRVAAHTDDANPSQGLLAALNDDLNTPAAIAELHKVRKRIRRARGDEAALELRQNLNFLGLDVENLFSWMAAADATVLGDPGLAAKVNSLIAARIAARKAKNWAEADRIRAELEAMGIQLKDAKDPQTGEPVTTWEVKR